MSNSLHLFLWGHKRKETALLRQPLFLFHAQCLLISLASGSVQGKAHQYEEEHA
jgi:hypothetical protein